MAVKIRTIDDCIEALEFVSEAARKKLFNGGAEMKVGLLAIVLVVAQGCATHVVESDVKSDSRSVIVHSRRNDAAKAQELADAECARYLRLAVSVEADPHEENYVFKCVDRFGN
jgi:hypothetical protein